MTSGTYSGCDPSSPATGIDDPAPTSSIPYYGVLS